MGFFNSKDLNERALQFKNYLKALNIVPRKWAADWDFSENAAYAYMDSSRSDVHLPTFMIETLPIAAAKNVLNMQLQKILTREMLENYTIHSNNKTILKQFITMQKEFQEYCMHVIKSIEDNKITDYEMKGYMQKWTAFYVAEVRLFGLIKSMHDRENNPLEML